MRPRSVEYADEERDSSCHQPVIVSHSGIQCYPCFLYLLAFSVFMINRFHFHLPNPIQNELLENLIQPTQKIKTTVYLNHEQFLIKPLILCNIALWRYGGVVTQRSAKPRTPVQFRLAPQYNTQKLKLTKISYTNPFLSRKWKTISLLKKP